MAEPGGFKTAFQERIEEKNIISTFLHSTDIVLKFSKQSCNVIQERWQKNF